MYTKSSNTGCPCGKGSQHSLRDAGRCDGMRRYKQDYKTPKELKAMREARKRNDHSNN